MAASFEDTISISIPSLPGTEIELGLVRHRLCEALFVGSLSGDPALETVWEAMGRAVESPSLSLSERMAVWGGVAVVGEVARIRCKRHPSKPS